MTLNDGTDEAALERSYSATPSSICPEDDFYAVVIRYRNHEEVLYQETMAPVVGYTYRPDTSAPAGRIRALSQE